MWKPADADRQSGGKERTGVIDGAWKLVGLHADKTDQRLATRLADFSDNPVRLDPPVVFVIGMQADFDIGSKPFRPRASSARAFIHASVLEGMAERNHWIG